ncbi:MAG: hypothetical protein U0234_27660 [Sandaracinus sp.]
MRAPSLRFLSSALASLLAVGCSTGGAVLDDRDAGDGGPRDGAPADGGADAPIFADATPDAVVPDAGPPCETTDPTPPADPIGGAWADRFANPGVAGDLPMVEAFAFGADDVVYVGGSFTGVGYQPASNVGVWDGGTGWAALGDGLPGRVHALAVDASGHLWAAHAGAGEYDTTHLSRFDGTSWTLVADADGSIQALATIGDVIYAGGSFTRIGGVGAQGVARLEGGTWSGWSELAPDGAIEAISAVAADDVCIGGQFTTLGALSARSAACWNGTAWEARSLNLEFYRGVFALAREPGTGTLFAAGDFMLDDTGVNGGSIARWVTDHWELVGGGVMSELGPGSTKEARGLGFAHGDLFVTGAFALVDPANPRPVNAAARWDGTQWNDLGGLFAEVGFGIDTTNSVALGVGPDGSVYFGGRFTRAGSLRVGHVVRWDGTYFSALRTPGERYEGIGGTVNALARQGSCATYVGGTFEYAGEVRANGIARYTRAGGYEALGDGVSGTVLDIAIADDGTVVAGGDFVDPGAGSAFRGIAYWDGTAWRGFGGGLDGTVYGVAIPDRALDEPFTVIAAGTMTVSGSTPIHGVGRWDGTQWVDLGAGLVGYPYSWDPTMRSSPTLYDVVLDPATGDVIIGGSFAEVGEGDAHVVTNNVARWDGTSWHAYGSGVGDDFGSVLHLTFWNGQLVATGSFHLEGSTVPAARWDGTAWQPLGTSGPDGYAIAAAEPVGPGLYAGGVFDLDGHAEHVAYFDGTTWSPLGAGLSDAVNALVYAPEGLYVGGGFDRAGTSAAVGIALYATAP